MEKMGLKLYLIPVALFLIYLPILHSQCESSGKVFVSHDDWQLADKGFENTPADALQYTLNLANWLTGGSPAAIIMFPGMISQQVKDGLSANGYTATYAIGSSDFTIENLQNYDAIFIGGIPYDDGSILIDYVNQGGSVYLYGGTNARNWNNNYRESNDWKLFLNTFGLHFNFQPYNRITGTLGITSTHPVFEGISELYQNNGSSVMVLNPDDPYTNVLEYYTSTDSVNHGLYAYFDESEKYICGIKNYSVCHISSGEELCVDYSSLNTHLYHNDYCGPCTTETKKELIKEEIANRKEEKKIKLYPNPFNNKLFLKIEDYIPGDNLFEIKISDFYGNPVAEREVNDEKTEIDLSNIEPGFYIYYIISSENGVIAKGKVQKK